MRDGISGICCLSSCSMPLIAGQMVEGQPARKHRSGVGGQRHRSHRRPRWPCHPVPASGQPWSAGPVRRGFSDRCPPHHSPDQSRQQSATSLNVAFHLLDQVRDIVEFLCIAQPFDEIDRDRLSVKVAFEVEQVYLNFTSGLSPKVGFGPILAAPGQVPPAASTRTA